MNTQQEERNKFQNKAKELSSVHNFLAIEAATGCHELNHPILMFNGTIKKVQDINIGDLIMGNDSTPRKVLKLYRGKENMYKISPLKGESFVVNENHILSLKKTSEGKNRYYGNNAPKEYLEISIKNYLNLSKYYKHIYKIYKSGCNFTNTKVKENNLSYFLGLWLGDGSEDTTCITSIDFEIVDYLKTLAKNYNLQIRQPDYKHIHITSTNLVRKNPILQFLQINNLIKNKHIPDEFLFSSRKDRLNLLAGLLDSDGYLYKNSFEICQKRKELLEQIQFLARSLGFYTNLVYKKAKCINCKDSKVERPNWRLFIGGNIEEIPTKIKRKQSLSKNRIDYKKSGFRVENLGKGDFYGFELDGNHLYLDGYFYVHHNSGKGLAVMKCIEADTSGLKWLILVPETLQIINLQNDIKKHNMEHIYEKIEDIICYASLHKFENTTHNIWLNEVHRLSECRTDISKSISYKKIIADSATISGDIKDRLATLGSFHYFRLSLKKAIETGIIPSPTIYTIGISPNDTIKRNKVMFGKKTLMLTDKQKIENIEKSLRYWKMRIIDNPGEVWITGKFNKLGSERKTFFAQAKTEALKKLLTSLKGKRYVCFTGSTAQCDEIGEKLAVHSKKGKKHNEKVLEAFNNKLISSIYFHKMGSEGMNLNGIEAAIIVQLGTGNDDNLSTIQKGGRAMRSLCPEIYILYCKETKDEEWLNKALKEYNPSWIKSLSI